jgi:squalene-hopene/tetraprenyl-beta-curcumene cyclase
MALELLDVRRDFLDLRQRKQRPSQEPWSPGEIHLHHRRGIGFLLRHLLPAADGFGSLFVCPSEGRVLETALTLRILERERLEPEWQQNLRAFLAHNVDAADLVSKPIGLAVLGREYRGALANLSQLMAGLEYARRRKYGFLVMLLSEAGLVTLEEVGLGPEYFSDEAHHRFSRLYGAALRLIYARRRGVTQDLQPDIDFLRKAQSLEGGWEQQSLITILAMLGLGREHECFGRGLEFLKRLTREDGGLAFCDNQNVWLAALGGLALQTAGRVTKPAQRTIADYLLSRQHLNGGWSFTEGVVQTDTDDTANAAQMLLQLDPFRYTMSIERAQEFFLRLQRPDGGYPTYEIAGESEVTMTANIVLTQSLWMEHEPRLLQPLRNACRFLIARQKEDGRFERSWSLAETYSMFRTLWALDKSHEFISDLPIGPLQKRATQYLLESQHSDGGWGQKDSEPSDALSTAFGLSSLCLLGRHLPIGTFPLQRAVSYLVSQQDRQTGEFFSIPDVVGPRPIPFNVTLFSTVFSSIALAFAAEALADKM